MKSPDALKLARYFNRLIPESIAEAEARLRAEIPEAIDGETGPQGVGVAEIEQASDTSMRITLTDGVAFEIEMPRAADGQDGRDGVAGKDGVDGIHGKDGQDGSDGVSITSIHQAGSHATVTLSDGQAFTLELPRGQTGAQGATGKQGERGPEGPIGPRPDHQWSGKMLRFERGNGKWGPWIDLAPQAVEPPRHQTGGIGRDAALTIARENAPVQFEEIEVGGESVAKLVAVLE